MERESEPRPILVRISKEEYKTALLAQKQLLRDQMISGQMDPDTAAILQLRLDNEDLGSQEGECNNECMYVRYYLDVTTGELKHRIYPKGRMGYGKS